MKALCILSLFFALLIGGCKTMQADDTLQNMPELSVEEYFIGKSRALGIVMNRGGEPLRYFTVDIEGAMQDGVLTLDEHFVFNDGEKSRRVWKIRKTGDDTYEGTADDVVGVAKGKSVGNALNWQYNLMVTASGRQWKIHLDDWMYLHHDGVLVNRAKMTKFGFKVGEIFISFRKIPETPGN